MSRTTPVKFVEQVKQEAGKVTWPTQKDTAASVLMVMIMVAVASVFFLFVDWAISSVLRLILGI